MLHWNREFGEKAEHWENTIMAGGRAPDAFYDRPEIDIGDGYLWQAFIDLGTERDIGMGLGPIPRSAARDYAAEIGVEGDRFDRFWSIISQVDNAYLKLANTTDKETVADQESAGRKAAARAKPVAGKRSQK